MKAKDFFHLIETGPTASTNSLQSEYIERQDLPEFSVVLTHHQTSGRGLAGNIWQSDPGKNLTISVLLYPDFLPAAAQFQLTKVVALALAGCVREQLGQEDVFIKWPNDIFAAEKKLAGILTETAVMHQALRHAVIGIGLNVNQSSFPRHLPCATSMKMLSGREYDLYKVLASLMEQLRKRYQQLKSGEEGILHRDYLSMLFGIHRLAAYVVRGVKMQGIIRGINNYGHLLLETEKGHLGAYDLKEVSLDC